jgi:periplasmic mercuric ion binding protein
MRLGLVTASIVGLTFLSPAAAETKVELKNVHMCCGGCAKEVAAILKKVDGVTDVMCDQETTTARFSASDAKAAQRALDALAAGGFHGDTGGSKGFAFPNDSGAKAGKVKTLTVSGFHNSCPGCVKSFRDAIKDVPGVAGDTAKSKVSTCQVTGDFDQVALVAALNKAGFHVKVK